jgi:hypothetical protein
MIELKILLKALFLFYSFSSGCGSGSSGRLHGLEGGGGFCGEFCCITTRERTVRCPSRGRPAGKHGRNLTGKRWESAADHQERKLVGRAGKETALANWQLAKRRGECMPMALGEEERVDGWRFVPM